MKYHILIISSTYLYQYMKDILATYSNNIDYRVVEYHSFSELPSIYEENETWADGILTTGIVVQTVLERVIPGLSKPLLSLATDNESFYRIPLALLIENRSLSPERIVFDVFVTETAAGSVRDLLDFRSIREMFPDFGQWLGSASLEDLYKVEEEKLAIIESLWRQDRIDMVICRYGNLVSKLKQLNIPCVFAASTDEYVRQTIQLIITAVKVDKLTAHSPAVISIIPAESETCIWNDHMEISLRKALMDFAQNNDMDFLIQKKNHSILVLTEKAVISCLTDKFQASFISEYLKETIPFPLSVSYGIGNTMDEAMNNADMAYRSSQNRDDVYLVDADHRLIGPLSGGSTVISSSILTPQIQSIAEKSSLSTATIHRINRLLLLLGKRELTSSELAENFHITLRGANRILQKLEHAGVASAELQKSSHMRGRPTKIYRIEWEI